MGDSVLARDHLSGQKWQAGTVVQQTSPASTQVQLNDGQNWRRYVDDVLQNTRSSAVTQSSPVEVTSDQSTEGVTSPSTESSTPHLKNQSQWSRQAHLLLPPLLRVGPNVLLNHHRD